MNRESIPERRSPNRRRQNGVHNVGSGWQVGHGHVDVSGVDNGEAGVYIVECDSAGGLKTPTGERDLAPGGTEGGRDNRRDGIQATTAGITIVG